MAQPSNTFDTYDAVGIREDLADVIYNISPTETPFMTNAAKGTATNTLHEWQTDGLRAAANNFQIEGDDYGGTAISPTDRLNNRTQISAEAIIVSGTDRSVDNAGRGDELAYQLAKVGKALKRDMEVGMVGVEQAKVTGSVVRLQERSASPLELGTVEMLLVLAVQPQPITFLRTALLLLLQLGTVQQLFLVVQIEHIQKLY